MSKEKTVSLGLFIVIGVLVSSELLFASSTSSDMPYVTSLVKFKDTLTGPVAIAVGGIAFVGAGFALVFGGEMGQSLKILVSVIFAVSILLGANTIVSYFGGKSGSSTIINMSNFDVSLNNQILSDKISAIRILDE